MYFWISAFDHRAIVLDKMHIVQWFLFKLLANFDFYLCLRINFHTLSFWVLILAAGGPYFTKKWVLIGSLSQSLGVFISFRGSAMRPFPVITLLSSFTTCKYKLKPRFLLYNTSNLSFLPFEIFTLVPDIE